MNDPLPIETRMTYWLQQFKSLAAHAEMDGVIVTIERVPLQPLAMRNHEAKVEVREKR